MNGHSFRFDSWAISDRGCVRELNEDRFLLEPDIGVWVVADGMGGHDAGEVASSAIVEHLATIGIASSAPDLRSRFEGRLARANDAIQAISRDRNGAVMGSTVVGLLAHGGQYAAIWSGDSRIYLVRGGQIVQLTRDHTEVQELLDRGLISQEQAHTWPRRNVITRAVGATPEVKTDIEQGQLQPGDVFLLCSDGLTAHVSDEEMRDAVTGRSPREACELLIETVLARGGTDNVTVVVVRCERDGMTTTGMLDTNWAG